LKDIFGWALLDFHRRKFKSPLLLHNEYGDPDTISLENFFSRDDRFTDLETFALTQVKGKILDVGAASGRHSIYLQKREYDITAMDVSTSCCTIIKETGVNKIINADIYNFKNVKYDTILMLMNGIGIARSIAGLKKLLLHLKSLLNPSGFLLFDSSDVTYLYEGNPFPDEKYYGQLTFHYEYKYEMSDRFNWLYIDQYKLKEVALSTGWHCHIIYEDDTDAYLARLQIK